MSNMNVLHLKLYNITCQLHLKKKKSLVSQTPNGFLCPRLALWNIPDFKFITISFIIFPN